MHKCQPLASALILRKPWEKSEEQRWEHDGLAEGQGQEEATSYSTDSCLLNRTICKNDSLRREVILKNVTGKNSFAKRFGNIVKTHKNVVSLELLVYL